MVTLNSFSDLLAEKGIVDPVTDIVAAHFDDICKSTLSFNAPETSKQFKDDLLTYLHYYISISRKRKIQEVLERSLSLIKNSPSFLTLADAQKNLEGTYLSYKLKKIAAMLYCKARADVTNSLPLLTENLWESSLIGNQIKVETSTDHSLRYLADSAVMEYFAIRNDAIDKLSADQVLDIRDEPLILFYIKELNETIEKSKKLFEKNGMINPKIIKNAKQLTNIIREKIYKKCDKEQRAINKEKKVIQAIEEVGGILIPGIPTAKKGITKLSRTMAKKYKISVLEYTTTPFSTYVSRFQKRIIG